MIADFETHASGTGERIKALEAAILRCAMAMAETFLNQALLAKRAEYMFRPQGTDWKRLPFRPIRSMMIAGPAMLFATDIDSNGSGWVRWTGKQIPNGRVIIEIEHGLACSLDELPEPLRAALDRLVTYLECGGDPLKLPDAVKALLRPYRFNGAIS